MPNFDPAQPIPEDNPNPIPSPVGYQELVDKPIDYWTAPLSNPGGGAQAASLPVPPAAVQPPPLGLSQPLPAPGPGLPSAPPPGAAPIPAASRPAAPAAPNAEAQALAQQGKAFEQQAQDKEAEGKIEAANDTEKAAALEQKAQQQRDQAAEYAQQQKLAQQAHADAVAQAQDAEDEYRNFKFQDFHYNKTTGQRITSIIAAFLGDADPDKNAMLQKIHRESDRDFDKQKLQLQSKENIAKLRREGVKDVDAYQEQQLARLKIKQGMALDAVASHIDALAATAGGRLRAPQAKSAADALRTQGAQKSFEGQATLVESKLKTAQTADAYAGVGLKKAEANKANAEAKAAGQKSAPDDDEIFFDKNHNPVGLVSKGRGGAQAFATRDANFQDAIDKMSAYRDYLASIGGRPRNLKEISKANVLYKNAGLAVGAVSPNGTTKEAQENEAATLGPDPTGLVGLTGLAKDSMLEAVNAKIAKTQQLKTDYRTQTLRPLHANQAGMMSPNSPAEPAPSQGNAAGGLPPGLPPGSIDTGRKTRDGRPVYKLANGQMVAPQ